MSLVQRHKGDEVIMLVQRDATVRLHNLLEMVSATS